MLSAAVIGDGLVQGISLGLVAVGFTLIYQASGIVNLANGVLMVLGGYLVWFFTTAWHWPFWLAAVAAVAAGAVAGVLCDLIIIGPVRRSPLLMQVIALLALSYVADNLYTLIFGPNAETVNPYAGTKAVVPYLGWSQLDIVIIAVSVAAIALLIAFLYRSDFGLRMRATADNSVGTVLCAINSRRVVRGAWAVGGALTTLAGALLLPKYVVSASVGDSITFQAFAAVVLGGFGSLTGALIGGIVVGVVDSVVASTIASGYDTLTNVVLMVLVLVARPSGLVGERL